MKFSGAKAVAFPIRNEARAHAFYRSTLGLEPALEDGTLVGYSFGHTVVMLKSDWYAAPSAEPNPRVTFEVENAEATEAQLRSRQVAVSDPVENYGSYSVGSFLDSEGNKIWFCSHNS
jgi:hypothetical protein